MAEFPWETGSRDMQFLVGLGASAWSAKKSFKYNQRLIQMQQNWQERMSNTAHQREVSDLRAAGLNPILSATGGSGASVGSASAPSVSVENPAEAGFSAMNMFNERKLTKQQEKTSKSQEQLNNSTKDNTDVNTGNQRLQSENIKSENARIKQETLNSARKTEAEIKVLNAQEANIRENTKYVRYGAETNRIGANASVSSARAANVSAGAQQYNSQFHPITHYAGKWVEDKLRSFKGSRFGKDLSRFGRTYLYKR